MVSRTPTAVTGALGVLAAWLAVYEANVVAGFATEDGLVFGRPAHLVIAFAAAGLCAAGALRRTDGTRVPWLLLALAVVAWNAGDTYWTTALLDQESIPVPSVADLGYLAFPTLAFVAVAMLLRPAVNVTSRLLLVDGVAAGLAVGALVCAIVMDDVLDSESLGINLSYAVTDLVLLGLVVGAVAVRGWRLDRMWALTGASILAFWIADTSYLLQIARDSYVFPGVADVGWATCFLGLAAAAWQPATEVAPVERLGLRATGLPLAFAALAVGVLAYAGLTGDAATAVVLAVASLVAVGVRVLVTFRSHVELLDGSREEALTDSLTGLGNRRRLMADLRIAAEEAPRVRRVLVLFDLDGFKHYNDSYGHPAGDVLLQVLGRRLAAGAGERAGAYRMGGDEFCVLAELGPRTREEVCAAGRVALTDRGMGFTIGASYGAVTIPDEVRDAEEALRTADQRMYLNKRSERVSASRQVSDVLVTALVERDGDLGEHVHDVARLAAGVAERLGLEQHECELIGRAAVLHDIGKVAVPDAILDKPGPLDDAEWTFMRRHTLVGERIVSAAPAMRGVAEIVRASHERWDGRGYPDGLAREDIPLGSRIVAVCDAFDAMRTARPYSDARPEPDALAELRACSGTQFDPRVVDAFCAFVASGHDDAVPA